ncbi:MAG: tRNA (adenosine(37)-N6)-dimethylallyltransferase MiaA [Myxococcaceae bacterium]
MVSQDLTPIVIAGPTGSGKSAFALELAHQINGEIICADSRQIYQRMSIGTACPSPEDYAKIKHHGFERLDPHETYSAGQFIVDTDAYVSEIQTRQKTPVLVGGTGLYLRAWRFGLDDVLPADPNIRAKLDQKSLETLYQKLKSVDPESLIHSHDSVRIKRALEIYELTGQSATSLRQTNWNRAPRIKAEWFLLNLDKAELDTRLQNRVIQMFEQGLLEEASELREYLGVHERLQTPGYLEALQFVDGLISKEQALELTFRRHRQYAKRQNTWFKKESYWKPISKP